MGIEAKFTRSDVEKVYDNFVDGVKRQQIKRLQYLGEICLNEARMNGNYQYQTGNLRSSIGYTVFVDGVAVHTCLSKQKRVRKVLEPVKLWQIRLAKGQRAFALWLPPE